LQLKTVLLDNQPIALCVAGPISLVTQLHDVVYVIFGSTHSTVARFSASTHQRLADINVEGLIHPLDMVACEQTSQLYIADSEECVWRLSPDGADMKRWLPRSSSDRSIRPYSLSVTSGNLLVTAKSTQELRQFDADGNQLRTIRLPDNVMPLQCVESPAGTFIVSHRKRHGTTFQVSEVNSDGQALRQFTGSRLTPFNLLLAANVATDSRGNIFVADVYKSRVLLLDAHLQLRRVIIDEDRLNDNQPLRLKYVEQYGQLLVGMWNGFAHFDVLLR